MPPLVRFQAQASYTRLISALVQLSVALQHRQRRYMLSSLQSTRYRPLPQAAMLRYRLHHFPVVCAQTRVTLSDAERPLTSLYALHNSLWPHSKIRPALGTSRSVHAFRSWGDFLHRRPYFGSYTVNLSSYPAGFLRTFSYQFLQRNHHLTATHTSVVI